MFYNPTNSQQSEEKLWEGKGIVENIFHLLWTKDPIFGTIPSLSIPETIIYKYDIPIFWYFMNENRIKKKNKSKLNNESIKDSFLKKIPKCGVVAQYFYKVKAEEGEETKVIFEYFNEEEFKVFIMKKNKPNNGNGVLQRFLQPKGDYNFSIKATWGPNLCLFEKKECRLKIDDYKYDLYERIFTYEAEDFHSRTVPLRGYILPNKIEKINYIIVQHVSGVSFERLQIERMVLNFKVDPNDNIWLLYCSFLQLKNTSPFLFTQLVQKNIFDFDVTEMVPSHINTQVISTIKPLSLRKNFFCYNCNKNIDEQKILEISYKTIIQSYDNFHYSLQPKSSSTFKPSSFTVPLILKRILPKLKEKEYVSLKKDPGFLNKKTTVCEECFLIIAKGSSAGGVIEPQASCETAEGSFVGIGRLRPEVTLYRGKITQRNIEFKRLIEDLRPDIKPQILGQLVSPAKVFSFEKLIRKENEGPGNGNEMFQTNSKTNLIDIPIRGSINGAHIPNIRRTFFTSNETSPSPRSISVAKQTLEDVDEIYHTSSSSSESSIEVKKEEGGDKHEKKEEEDERTGKDEGKGKEMRNIVEVDGTKEEEGKEEGMMSNLSRRRSSQGSDRVFVPKLSKSKNTTSRLLMPSGLIWKNPNPSLSSSLFSFDNSRKTSLPSIASHRGERGFEERNKKAVYLKKLEGRKDLFF